MNLPSPLVLLSLVTLGSIAVAAPAQDAPVDASSRVARILRGVLGSNSVHVRQSMTSVRAGIVRVQGVVQKPKPVLTEYTRVGSHEAWSKNNGSLVLARNGARWAQKNSDGSWSPSLRPVGGLWASTYLCDPIFLAERFLAHADKLHWKLEEAGEIDSRPVRKYSCVISEKDSLAFLRAGVFPDGGGVSGLGQFMVVLAGAGRVPRTPDPKIRHEVELYENPSKRLPARIVIRSYTKGQNQIGQVFVGGLGGLQQVQEDEEEEDESGKPKEKPASTLVFDFDDWGSAAHDDVLTEAAVKALEAPEFVKSPKASDTKAGDMKDKR